MLESTVNIANYKLLHFLKTNFTLIFFLMWFLSEIISIDKNYWNDYLKEGCVSKAIMLLFIRQKGSISLTVETLYGHVWRL